MNNTSPLELKSPYVLASSNYYTGCSIQVGHFGLQYIKVYTAVIFTELTVMTNYEHMYITASTTNNAHELLIDPDTQTTNITSCALKEIVTVNRDSQSCHIHGVC